MDRARVRRWRRVLLLTFAAGTGLAHAAVYYVNVNAGLDSNAGTSPATPWKTIQKAANTMVAGDTVKIMAGVYPESVVPQNSGEAGAPITYQAYGDGEVVIRPTRFPIHLPAWKRLEYLTFVGLTLDGTAITDRGVSYGLLCDRSPAAKSHIVVTTFPAASSARTGRAGRFEGAYRRSLAVPQHLPHSRVLVEIPPHRGGF